ncbi:capZ-interacting protein [Gastrophryne carolinensis]
MAEEMTHHLLGKGKSGHSDVSEEAAPPPSVAKLAGLFGDKIGAPRKEAPPHKPIRRKPPCSLPLPKPEATNNGDEKVSPHSQAPKIKVKSSPLIEKLQANLAFSPGALLPGVSPKSPGLKVMASPFSSPPSTPSSPGVHPHHTSESEESPVSFEQPPEGTPLPSYTKVRTRGSLKRRPPSRRFRKSQTDLDFDIDVVTPKENGDKVEAGHAGSVKDKEKGGACHTDSAPADTPPGSATSDLCASEKDGYSEETSSERDEKCRDNAGPGDRTLTTAETTEETATNEETPTTEETATNEETATTEETAPSGGSEEPSGSKEQPVSSEHSEAEVRH